MQLKRFINLMIFLISVFIGVFGTAKTKICSITLGSSNEINAIKNELSKGKAPVDFVELTEFSSERNRQDPWFKKACESGIQCDVLLISSHFSDDFYSSDLKLKLEEMETMACDNTCTGILQKPREVHLLGCASTSSNGSNLIGHDTSGFVTSLPRSTLTKNTITKFRQNNFRKLGLDNADRFRLIFANTPRIFGYTTVGPLGTQIESEYINYANRSIEYYSSIFEKERSTLTGPHLAYLQTVGKRSPLAQWTGDLFSGNALSKKVCDASNPNVDYRNQEIALMESLKRDPFFMFGLLQHYAVSLFKMNDFLFAASQLKNFIEQDTEVLEHYKKAFSQSKEVISAVQIGEILFLAGAISKAEYQKAIAQLAEIYKKNRLRTSDIFAGNMVCGLTQKLVFPYSIVTELIDLNKLVGEDHVVISCSPSPDIKIHQALLNHLNATKDLSLRRNYAEALSKQMIESATIETQIFKVLGSEQDTQTYRSLIRSLKKLPILFIDHLNFLKVRYNDPTLSPILREEISTLLANQQQN